MLDLRTMHDSRGRWWLFFIRSKGIQIENRCTHYTTVLNIQDIEFPMTLNQVKKFEHLNDISINVYCIENKEILPLQLSEERKARQLVVLAR